jgi:hypothetical protein
MHMTEEPRMTLSAKVWRVAAVIFLIGNAAGALFAFRQGERMHAEMHLVLFGAAFVGYAFSRAAQIRNRPSPPAEIADPRIDQLQRSIDAMALELERMGEKQRYAEKLNAENRERPGEH